MISGLIKTTIFLLLVACAEPVLRNVLFSPSPHLTLEQWSQEVASNIDHGSTNAVAYGRDYLYKGIGLARELYHNVSNHQSSTHTTEKDTIKKRRK